MSLLSTSEGGREQQRRKLAEGGKMPERAQRIRSGQGDRYSSAVCLLAQISGSKLAAKPEGITAQTHLQHYSARGSASQSGGAGVGGRETEGRAGENKYTVIVFKSSTTDTHCKYVHACMCSVKATAHDLLGSPDNSSSDEIMPRVMCDGGTEVTSHADSSSGQRCRIYSHHHLALG